jgi:heme exporter protein A
MLEVRDLECVRGRRQLFAPVSFVMQPGDCYELKGPNGSGKTSLLRMLCGLLLPTRGEVIWRGAPIGERREEYLAAITYVGHRPSVKHEFTAIENLLVTSALSGWDVSRQVARAALERMGLKGLEDVPGRRLSEGQQRRVALARLVACPTPVWLLDEVQTALDETATRVITEVIEEHLADGGVAVIATHQPLELVRHLSRRIELAA